MFARAQEKARQTACLNNVKQMGTGAQMYAQDYDETLPFGRVDLSGGSVTGTYAAKYYYENPNQSLGWLLWVDEIMPYVQNDQLFVCPSSRSWIGYGWNIQCGYRNHYLGRSGAMYEGVRLADFNKPAEFVMLADCNTRSGISPLWWNGLWTNPDHSVYDEAWPATHNDGVNVTFVDGHSKWLTRNQFMAVDYGGSVYWFLGSDN
ncbi:MAG: DUF1559 domain-containing protein [Armatimonadota bacterium]